MPQGPQRFGDLELDPANFQVRYQGAPLKLDRIPSELLFLLAARAGQLVTYQQAFEAIWGRHVVIEMDAALYTAVRKLRRALGETPTEPRFIETVARKGYRFIAQPTGGSGGAQPAERAAEPRRVMLAVLPLENLSAHPQQDYFSDGLTEELISELGRFSPQELGVIARTSVMAYKGARKSVAEIGTELGIDYLLEGSVRHERGRVRISLQLIRVRDQIHFWAETFDKPLVQILRVQAEVARSVAAAIRLKLAVVPDLHRDVDPEVYELSLVGRHLREQRTAPSARQAIQHFETALARDSGYAPAWAGLAACYATLAITSDARPHDTFPSAREASDRAIALDPKLSQGHVARGIVNFWFDWDWQSAQMAFYEASALNSSDAEARMFQAHLNSNLGRHEEAISGIRAARQLDPLSYIVNTHEAQFLYNARRYGEAEPLLERLLQLAPQFWVAHVVRGKVFGLTHQSRQALGAFSKAQRLSHGNTEPLALRGYTLAVLGEKALARRVLRDISTRARRCYVPPLHRALVLLGLGQRAATFDALAEAIEERDVRLTFLGIEPRWDPLRRTPQFEAIRQRIGLP